MELSVSSATEAGKGRVVVKGEVDVSNAESVRVPIQRLVDDASVSEVEVDLTDVPYIDSTGIGVLVGASHRAADAGKGFKATGVQPNVERIFGMLGVEGIIGA
jgi:anti-sigma B factor antagonist